jgi:hypothetical protein
MEEGSPPRGERLKVRGERNKRHTLVTIAGFMPVFR